MNQNDQGVIRMRVSGNTSRARHQSTLAARENLNRPSLHVLYVVGLNQLQTTRHSHVNFKIHSNDITYVKN